MWKTRKFGFRESEVLVIHTDEAGEITKKDLEKAREAARDIDSNAIKAIVSVMTGEWPPDSGHSARRLRRGDAPPGAGMDGREFVRVVAHQFAGRL